MEVRGFIFTEGLGNKLDTGETHWGGAGNHTGDEEGVMRPETETRPKRITRQNTRCKTTKMCLRAQNMSLISRTGRG